MNLEIYSRVLAGEAFTVDLSARARWRLTGPDGTRYLNGQVTQDISKLAEDHVAYAAVCTAKGRMEGDLFATRHGEAFFIDADPALRESLGARLDKYLVADDALFEDITDSWNLTHVLGKALPMVPSDGFIVSHARFGLPGHDVWTLDKATIVPGEAIDDQVVETIRLEHGLPRWGMELTPATLPPEAGPAMEKAISYTKGCYVGQEIIARLKSVGQTPRTLIFLQSETESFPKTGAELKKAEKAAGIVTSSGFSPRLKKGIALAYVPRALAVAGTQFESNGETLTVAQPLTSEHAS